ncbi:hypothetical protein EZV62_016974 [Acer yangbiense]|uniref:Uncharacterized protein n=1 Tax=Acer yangbiense TaxID=1000413 RepID=A0A5C7HQU1_9ROSI|nr:hypothetical protein EZV62_016974 [Acer yangbiense]
MDSRHAVVWDNGTGDAGAGGFGGGGGWGAATKEKRIYTNIANLDRKNFTLKPSNKITNSGGWVATGNGGAGLATDGTSLFAFCV